MLLSSSACQRQLAGGAFLFLHTLLSTYSFIQEAAVYGCSALQFSGDTSVLLTERAERKARAVRYDLVHLAKLSGLGVSEWRRNIAIHSSGVNLKLFCESFNAH